MLFNSYVFVLLFLPCALIGWFGFNKFKKYTAAKIFLLFMSMWFYAWFNIKYLPILVSSVLVNFTLGKLFHRVSEKKARGLLLAVGLIFNIGILAFFKYLGFFTENINAIFGTSFTVLKLLLPLGISFFTFQQLSYVIDSYKGTVPDYKFLDYALFVTFFPQLIAGPIVLHSEIVPAFYDESKKILNYENLSKGFTAFAFGMGKKVLIADFLGNAVNWAFANSSVLSSAEAFVGILAYSLQLYLDFSGYCDMATGIGLMFNIELPINFNSPYKALDVSDFWRRWHITLSRFLRQYIYFPLGGSRRGAARTYLNSFIVFFVSGLWHGANWTFVVWGLVHGAGIVLTRLIGSERLQKIPTVIRRAATFIFVVFAFVIFRADSLSHAGEMYKALFTGGFGGISDGMLSSLSCAETEILAFAFNRLLPSFSNAALILSLFVALAFSLYACMFMKNTNERIKAFKPDGKTLFISCTILIWSILSFANVGTFLYFNF